MEGSASSHPPGRAAGGSVQHPPSHVHGHHRRRGELAAAGGHPRWWTEAVQTFRSAPDECRMAWPAQTKRRATPRPSSIRYLSHATHTPARACHFGRSDLNRLVPATAGTGVHADPAGGDRTAGPARAGPGPRYPRTCTADRHLALRHGRQRRQNRRCTLHVAWDERLVDYHFGPGPSAGTGAGGADDAGSRTSSGCGAQPGVTIDRPGPGHRRRPGARALDPRYIAAVAHGQRVGSSLAPGAAWGRPTSATRGRSGWAPGTTRSSPACTTRRRWWPGRRWPRPAPYGRARLSTGPASRAACITPWPRMPAGSASATTSAVAIAWPLGTGCRAGRLRGHRRAPRRRGAGRVLGQSAGC